MNEHHTFFESFDPSLMMEILSNSNVMLSLLGAPKLVLTYVPTLTLLNLPTTMLGKKNLSYMFIGKVICLLQTAKAWQRINTYVIETNNKRRNALHDF